VTNIFLIFWIVYFLITSLPDFRNLHKLAFYNNNGDATLPDSFIKITASQLDAIVLAIDFLFFIYFALEYYLRLIACPKRFDFFKQPVNILDGLSINITLILLILYAITRNGELYYVSRISQAFKVFGLDRLLRLNWKLQTIQLTIMNSWIQLLLSIFYVMFSVLLFSTIIFYMEVRENGDQFSSIFTTFW